MSDDLTPQIRRAPFDALPHAEWPDVAAALTIPWPKGAAAHDLRWFAAEHAIRGAKLPSVRDLGERWGWTRTRAHDLLADADAWADSARPWGWRDNADKTKIRTASGQHPDSIRTVGGQTERTNAEDTKVSGHSTDTIRTASGHDPDSRAILTGSPSTQHPTPEEIPTGSAPAPAVAEPAPKAKRSPKVKPSAPAHARDVIAAWCDAFKDANGAPYPVNGREVGTLSRLAGDYVTGDEWEAKLGVLRTGMGAYIRDPRRFPPGPPTVGGFAQDPARWMQATGAPPAKPNGRPSFAQMLLNRNAAERPQPVNVTPRSTT